MDKKLSKKEQKELLEILKTRFEKNMGRHKGLSWTKIEEKLNPSKLWSLNEMERTGGEPDVVFYDKKANEYVFYDCSKESPDRRSLCYDKKAQEERKENKPKGNAINIAKRMGIEILDEEQYRKLQKLGEFDTKTSSWIKTPNDIRKHGGALFADYRYGSVFVYHNGAESYYSSRGFRGLLKV